MLNRLYYVVMFTLLVWGINICVPVHAQNKLDSLQHLNEVVVTARAVQKEIFPVQELSGKQLHQLSSHNVADALRYFSGIQIKDYGGVGGLKTVNIRSMGTNHVGVFYDGIELGNAQNGTVDLGRFSLDNMESVTLYNGQKSAIFQPAKDFGSSGSIYLQTRTPQFEEGKKYNVRASFKTGSFGVANPSVLWEQKLGQRISSSFSAEYLHSSGKYKFTYRMQEGYDTTAVRQNGDLNALRVEGGLFGQLKQGYWKAKAYLYNSERGYPGAIVRNKFSHEDRQWDTNFFTQGTFKKDFTQWYSLLANAKYAYDYLHYLADPKKDESLMYVNNHYYQQEVYTSVANRFNLFPWWEASFSADYQFNLLNADLRDFVYPRRHTLLASIATAMRFKQVELQASLLKTFVHDTSSGTPAPDKQKLTPSFFVSWRPFPQSGLNLRGFYKRIFRMPTLNDLYYTFIGNINLEPEFTTQYDLGFTYSRTFNSTWLRSLEVQTDVYYNEVENKIVATPTSNFFRWTMVNLGNVEIRGVDVALQTGWKIGRDLMVSNRINYTYQRAQDFTDPKSEFYGGQIPYIPWHSGSAVVNLQWRSWEANYSFIYTGERYSSQANIPYNYQLPWYTSDFSVSKGLKVWKGDLKLTLEVNNLLNQQYEVVICYPMPSTNFKLIAQYNF
ncbi:TonB-dependent receptor [uncultured Phocaeicola sp.]|uniref:TonB-dependent receptor n=1 Tax=uncultured Phocaeicola sp. TaxID=990718 RepID=UPI0025CD1C2D|nr:TonB-dependent receptor [uncultured Phocaeicola sp.]